MFSCFQVISELINLCIKLQVISEFIASHYVGLRLDHDLVHRPFVFRDSNFFGISTNDEPSFQTYTAVEVLFQSTFNKQTLKPQF